MKQLNIEDLSSPGAELLAVIRQYLRCYVSTAFLAEVTETYAEGETARVDVKEINIFMGSDDKPLERREILNLSVGVMGGQSWTISYPIKKGDIGLCIVSKYDLTDFLETGQSGETKLSRVFDPSDSVFIPLALYLQPAITDNLEIKSKDDKTAISITPDGNITINNAGNISITNEGDMTLTNSGNFTADITGNATVSCSNADVTADKVTVTSSDITLGGNGAMGVVTQACICSLTGNPHPDASTTVKATK